LPEFIEKQPDKPWALTGAKKGQPPKVIRSLFMLPGEDGMLEQHNYDLKAKYDRMAEREVMVETNRMDDADIAVVAFGTAARIAKSAIAMAREEGIKVGLIRPITLFPFPNRVIAEAAERVAQVLVVEMNLGQMVEDVRLAANGRVPVSFYGRPGGAILAVEDIAQQIRNAVLERGVRS